MDQTSPALLPDPVDGIRSMSRTALVPKEYLGHPMQLSRGPAFSAL